MLYAQDSAESALEPVFAWEPSDGDAQAPAVCAHMQLPRTHWPHRSVASRHGGRLRTTTSASAKASSPAPSDTSNCATFIARP